MYVFGQSRVYFYILCFFVIWCDEKIQSLELKDLGLNFRDLIYY